MIDTRRDLLKCLMGSPLYLSMLACSQCQRTSTNQGKILIIGAGMAGLSAARALKARGFDVEVLEARSRYGGRIHTISKMGVPVDMGATWIHGSFGNPMTTLSLKHGIKTLKSDEENLIIYERPSKVLGEKKLLRIQEGYRLLKKYMDEGDAARKVSVAQAVRQGLELESLSKWEVKALAWMLSVQQVSSGVDLESLSMQYGTDDMQYPGKDLLFPGGYGQLCDVLSEGVVIRYSQVVKSIDYRFDQVKVTTDRGTFKADGVVVTLPLGVLQSGRVQFLPKLPFKKRDAIKQLKMGVLNKVALSFDRVFWPKNHHFLGNFKGARGAFPAFLNMVPFTKTQAPVLVGFLGGQYAVRLEKKGERAMYEQAIAALRHMFGNGIPKPTRFAVTRWGMDPFAFGSYSHVPVGSTSAYYDELAKPIDGRVFFAGEATSRLWRSTVHGAWHSGVRVSKQVAKQLRT